VTILGVDIGSKIIGIAVSDENNFIALPLCSIKRDEFSSKIKDIIMDYKITEIVAGLPLSLNHLNTDGFAVGKTMDNAAELFKNIELPVHFQDERFTSVSAFKALSFDTHKPSKKSKSRVKEKKKLLNIDTLSATYILQTYLDLKKRKEEDED